MSASPGAAPPDAAAALAALRAAGAERIDPVAFRHAEALARRSAAHAGSARQLLDARLARLLADCSARIAAARSAADALLASASAQFPEAAEELAALHAGGEFARLRERVARLEAAPRPTDLGALIAHIAAARRGATEAGTAPASPPVEAEPQGDAGALAYFENIWAELKVEQQLAEALAQAPENAGPLNSHLLALQSLKLMRDVSPEYLKRFVSYVDALLWLDQAQNAGKPAPKGIVRGERDKKRKPPRGKAG